MDSKGQLWFPASSFQPTVVLPDSTPVTGIGTTAHSHLYHCPTEGSSSLITCLVICVYITELLVPFLWIPFSLSFFFFFYYWGKSCTRYSSLNLPANHPSPSAYLLLFPFTLGKIPVLSSLQGLTLCPTLTAASKWSLWFYFLTLCLAVDFDCGKTKAGSLDSCHSSRGNRQR